MGRSGQREPGRAYVALLEEERATANHERDRQAEAARLGKARARAERFRSALVALRGSRSYRLMRALWRLSRPFRRAPRRTETGLGAEDSEPRPGGAVRRATPSVARPATATPPPPRLRRAGEPLRVASILDEMSAACFAPECELLPLNRQGWRKQLDARCPDLLLVESAWNGNEGEWQHRIASYPRRDLTGLPALKELLDDCAERGIPTAFWGKEDPVHFDRFAEAASLFDHVFTTDARCVDRYRALPGKPGRTVAPLPFAAQPRLHNPAAVVPERSPAPCFAGAWYRDRHPYRRRALEALLDAARPHGLVVYDRRFGGDDGAYGFPERFHPHVRGRLPYERIVDAYKAHQVFLNANSVADSPTMCSRRVLELAACDTAILSTPALALRELLGEDLVAEAEDEPAASEALERLLRDDGERSRRTRAARRAVFVHHTCAERLATIAETAGLDASALRRQPFATPDGGSADGIRPSAKGFGEAGGGDRGERPWLLALQPGTELSEGALADLAAAARFADAEAIGVHLPRLGDRPRAHRHVDALDPRAVLLRRELVEARGHLPPDREQACARLREWHDRGTRLYAADADLLADNQVPAAA